MKFCLLFNQVKNYEKKEKQNKKARHSKLITIKPRFLNLIDQTLLSSHALYFPLPSLQFSLCKNSISLSSRALHAALTESNYPNHHFQHQQMSSPEQALASLLSQLALSFDGAVLGVTLAYVAVRSLLKYSSASSSLRKIRSAPSLHVSDLRSILSVQDSSQSQPLDQNLIVLRGTVEAKSAFDSNWKTFKPNVLVSQESGDKAVVIQRTQTVRFLLFILYFLLSNSIIF